MNPLSSAAGPIAFGRHAFDPWRGELRTAGARPVALGGCAVRVLQALIGAAGQVLTPAQLTARAWPGRAIHASNVRVQIAALRRALAGDRDLIGTVDGGYVFTGQLAEALPLAWCGRDALQAAVAARLAVAPIVTLTGAPGIGKSALARAVARDVAHVRHVPVDRLAQGGARTLLAAVGMALGWPDCASAEALTRRLPDAPLLLVLDNCDHEMDAASHLAEQLVRQRPALRVLATSRQTLRADGEDVVRLPPLAEEDAVRLLLTRVCGSADGLAAEVRHAAAQACRQLEGVPLALVLAAAQVRARQPAGSAAILDGLRDLAAAAPGSLAPAAAPREARHLSLRAASAWSEPLLSVPARRALTLLAGQSGWFTLEQAVALLDANGIGADDPVDCLAVLAAHSLLLAETTAAPARYRLALAARG